MTPKKMKRNLKKVRYGMTACMDLKPKRDKGNLDQLLTLIMFGDLVSFHLLPSCYSMRCLPYIVLSFDETLDKRRTSFLVQRSL
jgi:hypothetical protein